ncbi:MAG: hypothetical protein HC881_22195, partial [Leptolyngbyaceae cyanobacterium SL_7_1]|nr:hypothetical protein [Leptolyngbyaceae cyanobacterium SL_7_1]
MSEVNSSNEHDPAQSASSGSDWFSGWDDFAANTPNEDSNETVPTPSAATDWQTVNFPNAISVDAIDRQSLYA